MRKEYQTSSLTFADASQPGWADTVITIDLRHLIAAEPWDDRPDPRFTMVTLNGGRRVPIEMDYTRFLRDWHSVQP